MRYFIRATRPRTAARQLAKLALILCPVLLSACATGYHPANSGGGYTEQQLSRNVFVVGFGKGTRADDKRSVDLCLLRCAEVTLAHGFSHFVVLEGGTVPWPKMQSQGHRRIPIPAPSGSPSYVSSQTAKPSTLNTIACFRHQPQQFPDVYDAQAASEELALKYHVRRSLRQTTEPLQPYSVQFDLYSIFLLLPKTAPEKVTFLEPDTLRHSILIGGLTEWENPCGTLGEFKEKAAAAAAILGGQAILIRDGASGAGHLDGSGKNVGFVAELLLLPNARLGIQDEGGDWPRKEWIIRGFDKDSLAPSAGLKVGDRVIALDGTDVQRQNRFVDRWLSWTVGEEVVVTFVRDGTQMTTLAKTIAN